MRVGIDVSILSSPMTGIGRFTLSLAHALASLHEPIEWVLLGVPENFAGVPELENVVVHRAHGLTGARRVAWQQFMLPRLARRCGLDVLHCPDFSRPITAPVPVVNTIHDLSYFDSCTYFGWSDRAYKQTLTRVAVKKSARLVADSEFTLIELNRKFGLDDQRTSVIHLGVNPFPPSESAQEERPFILFVGTLEERKNLLALLEGFALMRLQDNSFTHRLTLVGKPGRGFDKIRAAVSSSAYAKDIEILGYSERVKVLQLYRSSDAVVMPSLYEGFGLPVLEAMALGAPVVCSRAASLPEIGGKAVEYFDPLSPPEIAAALAKVLGSEELRAEMRRKGLARAKQFTWEECARRYCEVYREVVGG